MNIRRLPLLAGAALLAITLPALGDIRLKVSNKRLGGQKSGDTRSSMRQLVVEIDNRNREDYDGATVEWKIIARDINSRKLSIASVGSRKIDIPGDEEVEIKTEPFSFDKKEGKVHRINENRPDLEQFRADPDTGTRYAGYVLTITHNNLIIANI